MVVILEFCLFPRCPESNWHSMWPTSQSFSTAQSAAFVSDFEASWATTNWHFFLVDNDICHALQPLLRNWSSESPKDQWFLIMLNSTECNVCLAWLRLPVFLGNHQLAPLSCGEWSLLLWCQEIVWRSFKASVGFILMMCYWAWTDRILWAFHVLHQIILFAAPIIKHILVAHVEKDFDSCI